MIKFHNFISAYTHFIKQKMHFRVLQEQAAVLFDIADHPRPKAMEITLQEIEDLLVHRDTSAEALHDAAHANYDDLLGGEVYLCESALDLLAVIGCDFDWANAHDGRHPNVTELPMTWDVCEYLEDAAGEPQWVVFMLCWTNAGGNIYYVPRHLWLQARVSEHIAMAN